MSVRVCVVGSINTDLTFAVEDLPVPGQTVLASALGTAPGGKGANQAVAAARAGAAVQFVGAVGTDDAAQQLRDHLRENGVGLDGLTEVPGPSGTAAIVVDAAAENSIVVAPGANAQLSMDDADVRAVVADSDVVLISLEIPLDTALAAARTARHGGAMVMVNASPAVATADIALLAEVADAVVVNETEAAGWLDGPSVAHLIVTRGADGAEHVGSPRFAVTAPAVAPVDTTGAGDVFAGVLAASWPGGTQHAMCRAAAAGALATQTPGAGDCAPRTEAIDELLQA